MTDRWTTTYSERERELTFAKNRGYLSRESSASTSAPLGCKFPVLIQFNTVSSVCSAAMHNNYYTAATNIIYTDRSLPMTSIYIPQSLFAKSTARYKYKCHKSISENCVTEYCQKLYFNNKLKSVGIIHAQQVEWVYAVQYQSSNSFSFIKQQHTNSED